MGGYNLNDLTIAKASSSQKHDILAINQQTFEDHKEGLPARFFDDGAQSREKLINAALAGKNEKHFILSAFHNSQFAGYIHCYVEPVQTGLKSHDISGVVVDISLPAQFRGKGIGHALLTAAEEEFERLGATRLAANVWQGNEQSYNLFRTTGFEVEMFEFGKRLAPQIQTAAPTTKNNVSAVWRYAIICGPTILAFVLLYFL
jgi:ribosomal protein S18 acetylase RimI-like enzyme